MEFLGFFCKPQEASEFSRSLKNPQILSGNAVRTIWPTEIAFFRASGSILMVKAEMNFWLRNEASPEGCYSARSEFLIHFLSYLKLLYVA